MGYTLGTHKILPNTEPLVEVPTYYRDSDGNTGTGSMEVVNILTLL